MDANTLPRAPLAASPAPAHSVEASDAPDAIGSGNPRLPVLTEAEVHTARGYVAASRAASTRKAYAADWQRFERWCAARNAPALPASPAVLSVYLSVLAANGLAPSSVARALAAIAHHHKQARLIPPHRADAGHVVTDVLASIRRSRVGAVC